MLAGERSKIEHSRQREQQTERQRSLKEPGISRELQSVMAVCVCVQNQVEDMLGNDAGEEGKGPVILRGPQMPN